MTEVAETTPAVFATRPNGGVQVVVGIMLLLVGSVAFGWGMLIPAAAHPYGLESLPLEVNTEKWPLIWCGAAAANFGVLLWLVGIVLRAIYFLPGRSVTPNELS